MHIRKYIMARWRKDSAEMLRHEGGSVIMLVGFIAFLLIMAVGVAVDMARAQILQQRISTALDAAGLAAALTVGTPPTGVNATTWANEEASRYFSANFPAGYLGSSGITCCDVQLSNGNNTLNLTASSSQATVFMQTFGVNTMSVGATSQVTRSNNATGMELVLVLDDTGSMNGPVDPSESTTPKIQALQTAANELIGILFGANDTAPNLYVGIVPFAQAVSVPGGAGSGSVQASSWMNSSDPNRSNWLNGTSWGGCVMARSETTNSTIDPPVSGTNVTLDISEDPPSTASFDEYFYSPNTPYYSYAGWSIFNPTEYPPVYGYQDTTTPTQYYVNFNPWGPTTAFSGAQTVNSSYQLTPITSYSNGTVSSVLGTALGPNVFCSPAVSPMMASATQITGAITTLTSTPAEGDTLIDLGLAWAWRMLSPSWQGLWNSPTMIANSLPLAYNTPNMKKVVVLMSDGANFIQPGMFSGYSFISDGRLGHTTADPLLAAEDADNRTLAVCQSLANNGVIIFTIGFGNPASSYPLTLADREDPRIVDVNLLQTCAQYSAANGGAFFLAPTNAQLAQAFQTIGNLLEQIRVSQ